MELRDIEIFLTLAEELHFSRTAHRLHVTQARVSQSIKKQERLIGGLLFERTSRAVRLTPLGEQLRRELGAGYRQIMDGVAAARTAARGTGTLTVGTIGPHSWMLSDAVALLRTRLPAVQVRFREIQPPAPLDLLRSGDVDIAVLWLPVEEPDLTVGPVIHTSRTLLMTGASHPYARRDAVRLEDLADCVFVASRSLPAYMEEALNPFRTPSGRPVPRGPQISTWQEALTAVATGQAVASVSGDIADFYPWPNLAFVPIVDAPPARWAPVWRTAAESPLVRSFTQALSDAPPTTGEDCWCALPAPASGADGA
ncbi:LysR family transcriptional regulator [Streptomyces griseochromogenes]|uniref:LysR family transcriptional regulator n=1 Tax=Streptomyces griseochromogenes TaxID=68214 RepID=UPI003789949C